LGLGRSYVDPLGEAVFSTDKIILVTGATGKQGGATASALLTDGWQVRALVRDPDAAPARALADAGAELVTGDLADRASLDAATSGAHGVFSVQPTPGAPNQPADFRPEDEVTQGNNVAEAAYAAGVAHLVYTSVIGADRPTGMPNVDSKLAIEQRIRELGVPATILRPVSFMENYTTPYGLPGGALATGIRADVSQRLIAVRDVGAFAALAFGNPDEYLGKALDIAGDQLTPPQIAAAITRATGRDVRYVELPPESWGRAARAYDLVNKTRYELDIPALRALHPGLLDFDTWLAGEGSARIETLLDATAR
jgi:uncharacterized protein YbjT (DUF2867 family)